jgi:predicted RNA methylase
MDTHAHEDSRQDAAMAEVGPEDMVYDLGCGDGRMIIAAARRTGARAVGSELDLLCFLLCQVRITVLGLRRRVRIVYGDLFEQDLSQDGVVAYYLLRRTNVKLERKLARELHPTTRIVSNSFTFPGLQLLRRDSQAEVYVYSIRP